MTDNWQSTNRMRRAEITIQTLSDGKDRRELLLVGHPAVEPWYCDLVGLSDSIDDMGKSELNKQDSGSS